MLLLLLQSDGPGGGRPTSVAAAAGGGGGRKLVRELRSQRAFNEERNVYVNELLCWRVAAGIEHSPGKKFPCKVA